MTQRYTTCTCANCGLWCSPSDHITEDSKGDYVKYNEKKEEAYRLLMALAECHTPYVAPGIKLSILKRNDCETIDDLRILAQRTASEAEE